MQSMRDTGPHRNAQEACASDAAAADRRRLPGKAVESRRRRTLDPLLFRERLLSIMDRKNHWAWPVFSGPNIDKAQLRIHFQQEYATYVRDFPVLLARIHGRNPPASVMRMLAENIY